MIIGNFKYDQATRGALNHFSICAITAGSSVMTVVIQWRRPSGVVIIMRITMVRGLTAARAPMRQRSSS